MSSLVVRNENGENITYFGSQFDGLESAGLRHLCVRTGAGAADVKKYALTSAPLNDKYKALKMWILENTGANAGKEAYIAQRYSVSASTSTVRTYTTSRVSNHVTSTTLRTASSSRLSTQNATRVSTHSPIYYASSPVRCTYSMTSSGWNYDDSKITLAGEFNIPGVNFIKGSSSTACSTSKVYGTRSILGSRISNNIYIYTYSITGAKIASAPWQVTATQSSRVSNYVSSQILSTASSSKLSTGNATRSSAYNTSSSMSTTSSKLMHNANL